MVLFNRSGDDGDDVDVDGVLTEGGLWLKVSWVCVAIERSCEGCCCCCCCDCCDCGDG